MLNSIYLESVPFLLVESSETGWLAAHYVIGRTGDLQGHRGSRDYTDNPSTDIVQDASLFPRQGELNGRRESEKSK